MTPIPFRRGDIWLVNFTPARDHEQDGTRPAALVSIDAFNNGPADLLIVAPLTRTARGIPYHVPVHPPEGGLRDLSFVMCDQLVTISRTHVRGHWGSLSEQTMSVIADRVRILLGL